MPGPASGLRVSPRITAPATPQKNPTSSPRTARYPGPPDDGAHIPVGEGQCVDHRLGSNQVVAEQQASLMRQPPLRNPARRAHQGVVGRRQGIEAPSKRTLTKSCHSTRRRRDVSPGSNRSPGTVPTVRWNCRGLARWSGSVSTACSTRKATSGSADGDQAAGLLSPIALLLRPAMTHEWQARSTAMTIAPPPAD